MFDILILKMIIVLLATGIAAYTDNKTGYIYNWLTIPLAIVGLIFCILDYFIFSSNLLGFIGVMAIAGIIYLAGYLMYYFGKMGGGDIKLFVGIHLMLPYLNGQLTILWVLIFSSLLAVMIVSVGYLVKLCRIIKFKELQKILSKNKWKLYQLVAVSMLFLLILNYSIRVGVISSWFWIVIIPVFLGMCIVILENEIRKYIYLVKKQVSKLEDGDVLAIEFMPKQLLSKLSIGSRLVLEEKDIARIKKLKLKSLPIYDNLPRFAPFIFLGVIFVFLFGGVIFF
jgi:archaeal preflagellin peptidase FlaK